MSALISFWISRLRARGQEKIIYIYIYIFLLSVPFCHLPQPAFLFFLQPAPPLPWEGVEAFPNKSRIWVSNPFSCKQLGHWSTCNISLESVRGRWFTGCWVWGTGAQGCSKLCHCIDSPQIASYSFTVLRDREAASFSEKRPTNSSGGSRDERKLEIVLCHCPFFLLPVIINNNHHFSPMLMSALRVYKSCWSVFFSPSKLFIFFSDLIKHSPHTTWKQTSEVIFKLVLMCVCFCIEYTVMSTLRTPSTQKQPEPSTASD